MVVGLDISLSSTGIAVVDDHEDITVPIRVGRVRTNPDDYPKTLLGQHNRMSQIEDGITDFINADGGYPDIVVVEGPSMGSVQGADVLSGNRHRVLRALFRCGYEVAEVSPSSLKLYATGSGSNRGKTKVTKQHVIKAVQFRYGDVGAGIRNTDEADALILAAIGCRRLGNPIESALMPAANLAAMTNIRWPESWHDSKEDTLL